MWSVKYCKLIYTVLVLSLFCYAYKNLIKFCQICLTILKFYDCFKPYTTYLIKYNKKINETIYGLGLICIVLIVSVVKCFKIVKS